MPIDCSREWSTRARRQGRAGMRLLTGTGLDEQSMEYDERIDNTNHYGDDEKSELTQYARLRVTVKRVLSSPPMSVNAVTMSSSIRASFEHPRKQYFPQPMFRVALGNR